MQPRAMNRSQERFFSLLNKHEKITQFWNEDTLEFNIDLFAKLRGVISHGELVLVKFFAAVWFHEDRYGFDITDAMSILDIDGRESIIALLAEPCWP